VRVTEALSEDGTSRALGASGRLMPDPGLARSLRHAGGEAIHAGPVVSTDLFYDTPPGIEERWLAEGMLAVEMESATLFALAQIRGVHAASVLLVSDIVLTRERIGDEDLRAAETALGELAMRGLALAETPGGKELPPGS
jgi:purine-nucleoside phosphorylase